MIERISTICWLVLGLTFLPAAAATTTWYEDYQAAERALAAADAAAAAGDREAAERNYREARQLLLPTIALRPDSKLKKLTYSFHFTDYLPYYHLGRAYEGLGELAAAVEAYEAELARKAIQGHGETLADLQSRLRRLRVRLLPPPSPTPSATPRPTATPAPRRPTPAVEKPPSPAPTTPTSRPTRPPHAPPTPSRTPTRLPPTASPVPSATPTSPAPATATATPTRALAVRLDASFTQPQPGSWEVYIQASHPAGLERVELYIDDALFQGWAASAGQTRLVERFAFDLDDGTHRAKVVVHAVGGARTQAEEKLRSGTSRLRSLAVVLPASLLSAAAGSWVVRWRRRRRAIARNFNPYIAGTPVLEDDMFFGRMALLRQVINTLHNNSLLLFGERRIGKTSLLHSIHRHLRCSKDPQYEFYPVLIDLEGTPEEGFFALLMSEICGQLDSVLDSLPLRFQPGASKAGYDGTDLVHDLRMVLRRLREVSPMSPKLILLLDEVDVLNTYNPKTNQRLRSIFMKTFARNLGLVMAGVQIAKSWDSEGSPWYNFFEEIPVRPFGAQEARQLITRPVQGIYSYQESAIERIVELSEGKPYLIQKICIACVNRVNEAKRRFITLADVESVLPSVLGAGGRT